MEENNFDAPMEGYLQKRFQAGIVKSLKKKWYVLKDGELRCYQNEDACKKNAEMYQDAVLVNHIQTVRIANENHGIEVVTQQKKFILVASSEECQKKWIKAIYDALKDNRPRSVSTPNEKTSPTRKISASKFGLPRMFTFNRKSLDETQDESQFYVHPVTANEPSHSRSEVGVQADVQADAQADVQADIQADAQADIQAGAQADVQAGAQADVQADAQADIQADVKQIPQTNTLAEVTKECHATTVMKTENADTNRHSITEGSRLVDEPEQGQSSCVECKPKEAGLDEALMKQHEVSLNENGDITQQEITEAGKESEPWFGLKVPSDSIDAYGQYQLDTPVQTTGIFSLKEPLHEKDTLDDEDKEKVGGAKKEKGINELQALLKSISEGRFSDSDEVFSSDEGSDEESETTQKGKSAFEQLQELLNG